MLNSFLQPPFWLFLRRFLTRCETVTWHSARAGESVLRQGNRSEEMWREFPISPWVRWVPVCGWLPCCVLLLCLLQVGRSDAPLQRACVGACVFYPSSDETLLKFTSVFLERECDWKRERLCTRTKFTQTDGEQLLGSTSGKLTARAVSLLQLYYINLDYCRCKSCCQSLWTEWLNVSLLHGTLCTGWGDIPGSLGVLGDLVIYIIVRRLSFYIDSQCALLNL